MPVLNAKGEAEALCAQLNREGQVDACVTADSDVFLFGAKCVIKHIQPNSNVSSFVAFFLNLSIHVVNLRQETFFLMSVKCQGKSKKKKVQRSVMVQS